MFISSESLTGKIRILSNGDLYADASDLGVKVSELPIVVRIDSDGPFRFDRYHFNRNNDIVKAQYRNADDKHFFIVND